MKNIEAGWLWYHYIGFLAAFFASFALNELLVMSTVLHYNLTIKFALITTASALINLALFKLLLRYKWIISASGLGIGASGIYAAAFVTYAKHLFYL